MNCQRCKKPVKPETNCCSICGVDFSSDCQKCNQAGYHSETCEDNDADQELLKRLDGDVIELSLKLTNAITMIDIVQDRIKSRK